PVGSAGHEKRFGPAEFAKVHGELPVQSAVDLGTHPSAASPIFIANAPITDSKGLGSAVLYAFFRKGASRGHVAVLNPIPYLALRNASNVAGQIGFGAKQ